MDIKCVFVRSKQNEVYFGFFGNKRIMRLIKDLTVGTVLATRVMLLERVE